MRYLVKSSPEYLGGFILFYGQNEGMVPMDVKKLLAEGPQPMPQMEMEQNLDFAQYGQMLRTVSYTHLDVYKRQAWYDACVGGKDHKGSRFGKEYLLQLFFL